VKDLIGKSAGPKQKDFNFIVDEIKGELTDFIKKTTKVPADKLNLVKEIYDTIKDLPAKVRRYVKELKRPEPAQPVPVQASTNKLKV